MENHGTVLGGSDLSDAFQRFETMELCARTIINAKTIGQCRRLSDKQIDAFEDQIPRLQPEFECEMHSSKEREIRAEITKIVRRACQQGMMISSYGTVSRRLKGNDFLITKIGRAHV